MIHFVVIAGTPAAIDRLTPHLMPALDAHADSSTPNASRRSAPVGPGPWLRSPLPTPAARPASPRTTTP